MKQLLTILSLLFITFSYSQSPKIEYKHNVNQDSFNHILEATLNGKKTILIAEDDELCLRIIKKADFNKNGFDDVLIEIITACGGTCFANSFMIFSYDGSSFRKTESIGYDWNGVEIKIKNSNYLFIIEDNNEGMNTEFPTTATGTYQLKDYEWELIEKKVPQKIEALKEIQSKDFFDMSSDETISLMFDLDNDGKLDEIICSPWMRWGRMSWKIHFGNGKKIKGEGTPKRIGILASKTKGYNDLVLDIDEQLKWNGSYYQKMNYNEKN